MKTLLCKCGSQIFIDDDVYQELVSRHWNCRSTGCVYSTFNGIDVPIANFILNVPQGQIVDHRDLNGHNNLRSNLRLASKAQNNYNRGPHSNSQSGIKGVFFCKQTGKWRVQVKKGDIRLNVGRFATLEEAKDAYNKAAKELHGEFAYQN
jgi:hypothetical protein